MIHLYTASTPNGHKASCTLEAMQIPYEVHAIDLSEGEQKTDAYLALNPNGRIPAIVDTDNDDFALFESGAIMMYLADMSGQLLSTERKQRARTIQWLMFQMSAIGPMMGQANVFYRYFPEKIPAAIDRYQNECRRLFEVLDGQLSTRQWLTDDYSIADIANWCWVRTYKWSGVSIKGLEHLSRWLDEMREQPGMSEGKAVPVDLGELLKDEKAQKEFTQRANKMVQK